MNPKQQRLQEEKKQQVQIPTMHRRTQEFKHLWRPILLAIVASMALLLTMMPEYTHGQNNNGCVNFSLFGPKRVGSYLEWNTQNDVMNGMVVFNRDNKLDAGWVAFGLGTNLQYGMAPADIMLIWKENGEIKHSMKQAVETVGKPHQANGTIFENNLSVIENDDGSVTVKFSKKFQYATERSVTIKDATMEIMVAMHTSRTPQGPDASTSWFIHQYNQKYQFNPMKISSNCIGPSPSPTPSTSTGPQPSALPSGAPSPVPSPIPSPSVPATSSPAPVQSSLPSPSPSSPTGARSSSHPHASDADNHTPRFIISMCLLVATIVISFLFRN